MESLWNPLQNDKESEEDQKVKNECDGDNWTHLQPVWGHCGTSKAVHILPLLCLLERGENRTSLVSNPTFLHVTLHHHHLPSIHLFADLKGLSAPICGHIRPWCVWSSQWRQNKKKQHQYLNSSGWEGAITYCIELVYYFSVKFTVLKFQYCAAVGLNIWVSDATDIWISYDGPGGCGGEANRGSF